MLLKGDKHVKRLGKFTGRVYSEKDDMNQVTECTLFVPDDISEMGLRFSREKNRVDCVFCIPGIDCCPEKMKAIKNGS